MVETVNEIWKDIKGYPNYQISNLGRIWNNKTQRYLKPSAMSNGYLAVNLVAVNGKRKKELVHRLVAIAFIPNPNHYPEVDHKDRNRTNNLVENLDWVSHSKNCRNTSQNRMIRVYKNNELLGDYCLTEVAELLGCAQSTIYAYFRRKQTYIKKIYKLENLL